MKGQGWRVILLPSEGTTTTMTVLRLFVRDYPGEPVPEETLTHPPSRPSSNPHNNNTNNPICKAPECQKTSVVPADRNSHAN